MEVARIASRFNMEPPGLVALEKEIAEEESHDSGLSHGSIISWQFHSTPSSHAKIIRHSRYVCFICFDDLSICYLTAVLFNDIKSINTIISH